MSRKLVVAGLAVIMLTAGCATLARQAFREPVVNLREVRLVGLGFSGGNLDVVLSVHNPNNYRLDATRFSYRVELTDEIRLASGFLDSRFTVQERDSTVIKIPIAFTYAGIGEAGRQLLQTGAVNYRVAGDVTVGTPVGQFTVPYSSAGRFTASAQ
jgi:LEA14-like dessication related protein